MIICDPRPAERRPGERPAPRLDRAAIDAAPGVSFALVHNGKTHGMDLMRFVLDELRSDWRIGTVTEVGPPSPGYGGDPADAGPAAEAVMAALSAVGD